MYFEPFQRVNAANTGFPCPKVPIRRKLRHYYGTIWLLLRITAPYTCCGTARPQLVPHRWPSIRQSLLSVVIAPICTQMAFAGDPMP